MKNNDKEKNLGYEIVGAAIEVHNALGPAFDAEVYKRALEIELRERGLEAKFDVNLPVIFKGEEVGTQSVDIIVEDGDETLIVEIWVEDELKKEDKANALDFLKPLSVGKGIVLNFGLKRLEFAHKPQPRRKNGGDNKNNDK